MTGPTAKVRRQVIERDVDEEGYPTCQWCGSGVRIEWGQYSLQHRRARGMGSPNFPDKNLPQNLVLVHGSATTGCHSDIESHRDHEADDPARVRGFRLGRVGNPAHIPLIDWAGRAWLLNPDGTRTPVDTKE